MLNQLLKVSADLAAKGYPKDDVPFGEVALYALLGFLVVFLGISFLILVVWAVGKIMAIATNKPAKKKEEPKTETPVQASQEDEISEETVAVITAALMAYYTKQNRKCEFTVKRIKKL